MRVDVNHEVQWWDTYKETIDLSSIRVVLGIMARWKVDMEKARATVPEDCVKEDWDDTFADYHASADRALNEMFDRLIESGTTPGYGHGVGANEWLASTFNDYKLGKIAA